MPRLKIDRLRPPGSLGTEAKRAALTLKHSGLTVVKTSPEDKEIGEESLWTEHTSHIPGGLSLILRTSFG